MKLKKVLEIIKTPLYKAIEMNMEVDYISRDDFIKELNLFPQYGGLVYQIYTKIENPISFLSRLNTKCDQERVWVEFTIQQLVENDSFHNNKEVKKANQKCIDLFKSGKYKDKSAESAARSARSAARSARSAEEQWQIERLKELLATK